MIVELGNSKSLEVVTSDQGITARVLPDGIWHVVTTDKPLILNSIKVLEKNLAVITYINGKVITVKELSI